MSLLMIICYNSI